MCTLTYLHRFPPENEECFSSLRQKSREFVHEYVLYLVRLLDPYANPYAVDARLYEDLLVFVAGDSEWVEENFWGAGGLDLWNVVSF